MLWLHHMGHRVKDMDSAVELFKMLGYYVEVEKMLDAVREQYLSFIVHEKTRAFRYGAEV